MKRTSTCIVFSALAVLLLSTLGMAKEAVSPVVRWPAVAGLNYPSEPEKLLEEVRGYFGQADVPDLPSRLVAVVASAAPYKLAGPVSAHAFKSLQPGQYERVIIIAPAHGPMFENCSIPSVDIFISPLGPVPLDAEAVHYLLYSPLFHAHQLRYDKNRPQDRVHEYEFAVESLLPYLQERLLEFQLVPILVGDLRDPQGRVNKNTVKAIADTIKSVVNERTLIVVSTNFTQYGADYGSPTFEDKVEDNIARLDRLAFERLLALDADGLRATIDETHNVVDGKECLQIMLYMLPPATQARILAYETSMTKTGEKDRSVSYAAFVFHDPGKPALTPQAEKVRPLILRRAEKARSVEGEGESSATAQPPAPESAPAPKEVPPKPEAAGENEARQ